VRRTEICAPHFAALPRQLRRNALHLLELHKGEPINLGSIASETTGVSVVGALETETGQRYLIVGLLSAD
jgi:hypothetical protein